MLGPTIASAMTSHLEDFAVMLPGIWVQALSPIWLAYDPSSKAAIFWVFFLSVGEGTPQHALLSHPQAAPALLSHTRKQPQPCSLSSAICL